MATVQAFVRVSKKKIEKANIRFRLRDGRDIDLYYKSEIEVNPDLFDSKKQIIKAKVVYDSLKRAEFNKSVNDRKELILSVYNLEQNKKDLTSDLFEKKIDALLNPVNVMQVETTNTTFISLFAEFIEKSKFSEVRKKNFRVVLRALQRFELYTSKETQKQFKLNLDTITTDTLNDFDTFLRNEHSLFDKMPEIYKAVPESRDPKPRGNNTISGIFTKIRSFYIWVIKSELTTNDPFKNFQVDECVYGTPYYITIEERNKLYQKNLSDLPKLEVQRDIFVFQCLIGCRIGDLYKMTKSNIIDGAIEYIARKTAKGRLITVKVPLNTTAKEILKKYQDTEGSRLFPFIPEQYYNKAIKEAFTIAELTRIVTIVNPTNGKTEQKALDKIASSHLARRCFIGNLYQKTPDPNLIGEMSGHAPGSRSFARYKHATREMLTELVNMLD
jgi:site-specific recombinase XerD